MAASETQLSNEQAARYPVTLGIAAFAAILGGYFAVQPFFRRAAPHTSWCVNTRVSVGCATRLGFYGHSIEESVVAGTLLPAGSEVRLSDPGFPPIQWISGALIAAGYTHPVAIFMFVIGAALRRDGTVRNNYRRIDLAVIVSLLVVVLIAVGGSPNTITSPGGDP